MSIFSFPFELSIDLLPGSKLVLIEYNYSEPQQAAANKHVYDEQFIVAKMAAIKRCAKKFLLNTHIQANVAERIEATNAKAKTQNNNDKKI